MKKQRVKGYVLSITGIFFFFALSPLILNTFPISLTSAQELCSDDSQCADNIHYQDSTTNECIHKHGGVCDPGSEFTDPNTGCVYVYDTEEDSSLCQTPIPNPEPEVPKPAEQPTPPKTVTTPPPEEQAVYSQSQGLLPGLKNSPNSCNLNPIQQFFSAILSIFHINFCDPQTFYNEAKFLHQSELPKELVPGGDSENQIKGFLGGPTSSYGVTLPEFNDSVLGITSDDNIVTKTEKRYERSHFPAGITPITGK